MEMNGLMKKNLLANGTAVCLGAILALWILPFTGGILLGFGLCGLLETWNRRVE